MVGRWFKRNGSKDGRAKAEYRNGNNHLIECRALVKTYHTAAGDFPALREIDFQVGTGEFVAIIGNSGSGKSTLLNMIGGLDIPSAGRIEVAGEDLVKFSDKDFIRFRREVVGFVWQNVARNLIPYLNAMENVEIPMFLSNRIEKRERAKELLDVVGLSHRRHSKLGQLSGGEQQRVAIAIAMANEPKLILADEPTGNVDSNTAGTIFDAFRSVNKAMDVTIVIVTHDRRISRAVDRVVAIRDGRTSSEFIRRSVHHEDLESLVSMADLESHEDTHEELAVLDRVGRLQLPREYLEELDLTGNNMVRVDIEGHRIIITRPEEVAEEEQPGDAPGDEHGG